MIPYGKQLIDGDDIAEVVAALNSDYITTGPRVSEFEEALCVATGAKFAVAVSSGTAALHCAAYAAGIGPGDEVIVPSMTFAASSNCILYQNASPVFCDVLESNLTADPKDIETKIGPKTKAIIAVDYAGHPCDYAALREIASRNGLMLIADACHSIGGRYGGQNVGTLADMTCFSFHPVKHITTGEGGAILTDSEDLAGKMRTFRNHGISTDYRQRERSGAWFYEMVSLGYNYRITDFQCALGKSQLKKLAKWVEKRNSLAARYDEAFTDSRILTPLLRSENVLHAYHLYVAKTSENCDRNALFKRLRSEGIGVNVHYIPVHLHPYYRDRLGMKKGICPVAEKAFEKIISLPLYPGLTEKDQDFVIKCLEKN